MDTLPDSDGYDFDRLYDFACPCLTCEGSVKIIRIEDEVVQSTPDGVMFHWDEIYQCDECGQEFYIHQSN